jgi:hypothetical protein
MKSSGKKPDLGVPISGGLYVNKHYVERQSYVNSRKEIFAQNGNNKFWLSELSKDQIKRVTGEQGELFTTGLTVT